SGQTVGGVGEGFGVGSEVEADEGGAGAGDVEAGAGEDGEAVAEGGLGEGDAVAVRRAYPETLASLDGRDLPGREGLDELVVQMVVAGLQDVRELRTVEQ